MNRKPKYKLVAIVLRGKVFYYTVIPIYQEVAKYQQERGIEGANKQRLLKFADFLFSQIKNENLEQMKFLWEVFNQSK